MKNYRKLEKSNEYGFNGLKIARFSFEIAHANGDANDAVFRWTYFLYRIAARG